MEEAWELAALVMSDENINRAPIKVDWSGRHVRLKYQMFLSCLLLYCVVKFEVTSINVFGVIQFKATPTNEEIFYPTFIFAIFSTIAFVIRSFFESAYHKSSAKDSVVKYWQLQKKIRQVKSSIKKLRDHELLKKLAQTSNDVTAEFVSLLSKNDRELRSALYAFEHLPDETNEWKYHHSSKKEVMLSEIGNLFKGLRELETNLHSFAENRKNDNTIERISANALSMNFESQYTDIKSRIGNVSFYNFTLMFSVLRRKFFRMLELTLLSVIIPVAVSVTLLSYSNGFMRGYMECYNKTSVACDTIKIRNNHD